MQPTERSVPSSSLSANSPVSVMVSWDKLKPELADGCLRSVRVGETEKNWAEVGDHC
jgi:hypothetical protein